MVARKPFKDTLQVQCRSCLLTNSSAITKPGTLVPVQLTAKWLVSGFPEFYEKCLILKPIREIEMFATALQPGDVKYRRLALHLTSSSNTQIRTHPILT
jgi:hypothetical protein